MKSVLLYLYLVAMFIRPQDWVPGAIGLPTAGILIPLGIAIGLMNISKDFERYRVPQNLLMVIYIVIIFISTLSSAGIDSASTETITFLQRISVYFMTIWLLDNEKSLLRTFNIVKLLALFLAFQAVLQAFTGESWGGLTSFPGYTETRVRWYGDWDGPNVFGLLFVIAFGFCAEYVLGPYGITVRTINALLCLSYLSAIYYTNSRGAVLAVSCSLMFLIYFKKKIMVGIVLGAVCIAAIIIFGPSRMGQISSGESSAHERTWLWEQGLNMLRQHPIMGVGRGQFAKLVQPALIAHNNYVQNFAELGFIGFFLYLSILWLSFKGSYIVGYCSPEENSEISILGRSICCSIVGFSVCTFFVVMELDIYYFLIGLSVATYLVGNTMLTLTKISFDWKDTGIIITIMAGIIAAVWVISNYELF
jgi:putative inorganic carbon (hco3(-)) transporter